MIDAIEKLINDPRIAPVADALGELMSLGAMVTAMDTSRRTPAMVRSLAALGPMMQAAMVRFEKARAKSDAAAIAALPALMRPIHKELTRLRADVESSIGKQIVEETIANARRARLKK